MHVKLVAALLCLVAVVAGAGAGAGAVLTRHDLTPAAFAPMPHVRSRAADPRGHFVRPRKVALMILENRSYEQIIGNRAAPFLNRLARHNALETRTYAIAHPSLPNYIALTGGSPGEIHNDCASCDTEATNFVDQLDGANVSWRAYFQSIPATGSPTIRKGNYSAHYNPFTYFARTRARAINRDRIVSFTRLHRDLSGRGLPRFSWISPDLGHDGHNNSVASTDRYASRLIPRIRRALGPHGLLYVTWDEGKRSDHRGLVGVGGGRIPLIAAGPLARHHATSARRVNQYALLRSLEAGFGLNTLGNAGLHSTPLLTGLITRPGA